MTINITLPTYNEEKIISQKLDQLFNFCQKELLGYQWLIIVADNGSFDKTLKIVQQRKKKYPNLKYFHLNYPSKGAAIKKAWQKHSADINIFMDADLSTELKFIPLLIKAISEKNYQVAIGSRHHKQSQLKWSFFRIFCSRAYNLTLKLFFNLKLTDTHCGFKAVSQSVVEKIIPKIKSNDLFFDTELLILACHYHLPIKEIPVNWREEKDRKTKIKIIKTSLTYLREVIKLKWRLRRN